MRYKNAAGLFSGITNKLTRRIKVNTTCKFISSL